MINFEIYEVQTDSNKEFGPKKGQRRVIFPDADQDFAINPDDKGMEYFHIPNILHNGGKEMDCLFQGRIKDAVDMIMSGDGHALMKGMFGNSAEVIRYVDEEYGEIIRQKTIEGWKDVEFGWGLNAGSPASWSGYAPVCENLDTQSYFMDEQIPILFFKTEAEATKKMDTIKAEAFALAGEYFKLSEKQDKERFLDEKFHKDGKIKSMVGYHLFSSDVKCLQGSEKHPTYCLEVVQTVKYK